MGRKVHSFGVLAGMGQLAAAEIFVLGGVADRWDYGCHRWLVLGMAAEGGGVSHVVVEPFSFGEHYSNPLIYNNILSIQL